MSDFCKYWTQVGWFVKSHLISVDISELSLLEPLILHLLYITHSTRHETTTNTHPCRGFGITQYQQMASPRPRPPLVSHLLVCLSALDVVKQSLADKLDRIRRLCDDERR